MKKSKEKLEDAVELKQKFKRASEDEKQKINLEVKRNEEKFTAADLNSKGVSRYQSDDLDGAIKFFRQAIKIAPQYSAPWSGLGWIHNDRGEYDKAIECFRKAVELYDQFAPAWNGLGCAYNYKGTDEWVAEHYVKAIEYCRKAIALDAKYAAPWNGLGCAYGGLGNFKKSYEAYKRAVELEPEVETYKKNLEAAQNRL